MTIFRGDNTSAFGTTFITINIRNPYGLEISKALFRCGELVKEFENPVFPLYVNFTEEETKQLAFNNVCYLAVWDTMGRKRTCEGHLKFKTKGEVV